MPNKETIELIKKFEGCKLTAYLCPAKVPTIGYGHTDNVRMGDVISQRQAEETLHNDLLIFESRLHNAVKVSLTENQRGALVSFAYNVGITALKNSTLLQYVNNGNMEKAANEFLKWDKATVNGQKVALAGLTARRRAESRLFLKR